MPFHKSIRIRRGRKRILQRFDLQLTSMMDILVIIVVFLLKSYSVTTTTFNTVPGIQIPLSTSQDVPSESQQVIVTASSITMDSDRILDFMQDPSSIGSAEIHYDFKPEDLDESKMRIIPLYKSLVIARQKSELLRAQSKARTESGEPLPFDGVLAIQADKGVPYDIIRRIMYTSATAGYKTFKFLAIRKDMGE